MDDRLKSAESAILFIQKEHERVLHGLHMEIERLQQKCSGNWVLYGFQYPSLPPLDGHYIGSIYLLYLCYKRKKILRV